MRKILPLVLGIAVGVLGSCYKQRSQEESGFSLASYHQVARRQVAQLSLEEKIGQLFILSVSKTEKVLLPAYEAYIKQYRPSGFILYEGNLKGFSRGEVQDLLQGIRDAYTLEPFLAVDEEGGTVSRLDSRASGLIEGINPSQAYKAQNLSLQEYFTSSQREAQHLQELGFNWNYAPVVDLHYPNSPMEDRPYSADPQVTVNYAGTMLKAYHAQGVLTSLKHFPGLGDTVVDTHVDLATLEEPLEVLKNKAWIPFFELSPLASSVMVGHAWVKSLDPEPRASSFSPIVLGELKKGLGSEFQGLLVTDALDMGALQHWEVREIFKGGFLGGIHIFLLPFPDSAVQDYYQAARDLFQTKELSLVELDARVTRVLQMRAFLEDMRRSHTL